jgi:oligoribonuclease NrnB/cAMP/cGMP phosphodiesterase (DHH superfamily)
MNATQITHHDLDGYGASTVAGLFRTMAAVIHVPRYADVGPVVEAELKRLGKAAEPELILVTDLGLEDVAVKFIRSFAALNRRRDPGTHHRLLWLDHHVSSLDRLAAHDVAPASREGTLSTFDLGDPGIAILIDTGRSATRMTFEHRDLFADRGADPAGDAVHAALVAAVDAVDLWQKGSPAFRGGQALDEAFWDNVTTLVPPGHPWHERFVGVLLLALAENLAQGAAPGEIERQVPLVRARVLDALLADDPLDDRTLTSRMRIAPVLARSRELFGPLSDGTLLSFGLDGGTFQRVSDAIMATGAARRVANVQRTGSVSFRSIDGSALAAARRFHGGGHEDAAGGKLPSGSAFSLADARAQVEPILNPKAADPSASPFAALQNWKG